MLLGKYCVLLESCETLKSAVLANGESLNIQPGDTRSYHQCYVMWLVTPGGF